jgi:hypothetical protein
MVHTCAGTISWMNTSTPLPPLMACSTLLYSVDYLKNSFESGDIIFPGGICHLKDPGTFEAFKVQFYHKKWVVYCKPPFADAEGILKYLGRYTHRIAISNNRILNIKGGNVSFRWRDYYGD